jgi:hypothetical protein
MEIYFFYSEDRYSTEKVLRSKSFAKIGPWGKKSLKKIDCGVGNMT